MWVNVTGVREHSVFDLFMAFVVDVGVEACAGQCRVHLSDRIYHHDDDDNDGKNILFVSGNHCCCCC